MARVFTVEFYRVQRQGMQDGPVFSKDKRLIQPLEVSVKTFRNVRNVVGVAGLLLGAYIFVRSIPDVARYVRISTM